MKLFISIIAFVLFVVANIADGLSFEWNCEAFLQRAANSNSIELAEQNLATAVGYLDDRGMTDGNTGIIFHTPDRDVHFWYTNIKTALTQLQTMNPKASELEKSNMLIKLRETLIRHTENGETIIVPPNISNFPFNVWFFFWGWTSFITMVVFFFRKKN